LRDAVASAYDAKLECVCLIFAGKILKDGETLAQHNIKDGITVHLVIKQSQPPTSAPTAVCLSIAIEL